MIPTRPKVVVTDYAFDNLELEASLLRPLGADLVGQRCRSEAELIALVAEADGVLTQFAPLTPAVIQAMRRARVIVRYGIGVDNVNLEAAARHGIPVCNVPDYCTDEVADHSLALLLALTRQIPQISQRVRAGQWRTAVQIERMHALGHLTVGVVGFGRIGREVVQRLRPFKCTVLVHDPLVAPAEATALGATAVPLLELWARSDAICLHCPSTAQTRHLVNAATLAQMKRGVLLVNVARGSVVNQPDLIAALERGQVGAAALDVTDPEPVEDQSPLLGMDNVIITNHVASCSLPAVEKLRRRVAEIAGLALRGEPLPNVVNREALEAAQADRTANPRP